MILVIGQGFSLVILFVAQSLIAKNYGPEAFGYLSIGMAVVAIMTPIINLGLIGIVVKDLVEEKDRQKSILNTVFLMRFTASLIMVFVFVLFEVFVDLEEMIVFWIFFLLLNEVVRSGQIVLLWFEAEKKSFSISIYRLLASFSFLLFLSVVLYFELSIKYVAAVYLFEGVVGALFLFLSYKRKFAASPGAASFNLIKSYIRKGSVLIFSGFAAIIYMKIDQLVVGYYYGAEEVGIYAVAVRVSELWYFVPMLLVTAAFPSLVEYRKESSADYKLKYQKISDFLFVLGVVFSLVVFFIGEYIVIWFFGDQYYKSLDIVNVYVWGGVFVSMRYLVSRYLILENLLKFSLVSQGAGALLNLFLNVVFVPHYGVIAAAYTTVFSYFISGCFIFLLSKKTRFCFIVQCKSLFYPLRMLRGLYKCT